MDVLDSPLNLAHQRGRQAELLVNAGRYDEAVQCHKQAADYLAEAMTRIFDENAIESMQLQRERHIKQEVIIRNRQRRAAMLHKELEKGESRPASKTPSQSGQVVQAALHSPPGSSTQTSNAEAGKDPGLAEEHYEVYETMDKCDSLLKFLNNRAVVHGHQVEQPEPILTKNAGIKRPKEDKEIIEELRIHNDALHSHVLQLLRENEEQQSQLEEHQRHLEILKYKNHDLQSRLDQVGSHPLAAIEEDVSYCPFPANLDLHKLPTLELPPLEVPKFDYNVLKPSNNPNPEP